MLDISVDIYTPWVVFPYLGMFQDVSDLLLHNRECLFRNIKFQNINEMRCQNGIIHECDVQMVSTSLTLVL